MPKWKTERRLDDPAERASRSSPRRLSEAHIAPLNQLVDEIRDSDVGDDSVPYVDPDCAGVNGRVLMLLRVPSRTAADNTGVISPDNPDPTADNFTWLRDMSELRREDLVYWNVVPWWIGKRNASVEAAKARSYLEHFLELVPGLEVVVCVGEDARKGWGVAFPECEAEPGWKAVASLRSGCLLVLHCPHTSFHNIDGGNKDKLIDGLTPTERILATFHAVRTYLDRPAVC
ncbi:MAG: hypothetical protein H0U82_06840 [Actinobacteria bacterium]|nr:hypothetical protein [Actinomycetota bacterium]